METINKLLILTLICALAAIAYIVNLVINGAINGKNFIINDKNSIIIMHPYNECLKLLIDQANKESIKFNPEQAKSVCFDLLDKVK